MKDFLLATVLCTTFIACQASAGPARAAERIVQAIPAAAFVDSIGVNTHLAYFGGAYVNRWPEIRDALLRSGIRHVRDNLNDTTWRTYYDRLNELGDHGIGVTLIANLAQKATLFASYPSRVHRIDAYENPNEADYYAHSPDWARQLRAFAPILWQAAKGLTPRLAVIGPSLQTCEHYATLGDLSAFIDYGSTHDYVSGRNPGTSGYGPRSFFQRDYGSLAYLHACARLVAGSRPLSATETGYTTNPGVKIGIPPDVAGRYIPRMFLEQLRTGTVRTFAYELIDEGGDEAERHYGLLDADLHPKPAFVALSALIAELNDSAVPFQPDSLPLSVDSAVDDIRSLLFEKRDRSFVLAIWREVPCYDVARHAYIPVQAVETTVRTGGMSLSSVSVKTFDERGALHDGEMSRGGTFSLAVSDRVSLVFFRAVPAT
jgi:hypothetical protein